jgi:hypothetical protein
MLLTKFCFNSIPLLERCQANKIVWIFGHTHYGCDFTMNLGNKEIRFISNPYKNENLNKPFTEEEFELN